MPVTITEHATQRSWPPFWICDKTGDVYRLIRIGNTFRTVNICPEEIGDYHWCEGKTEKIATRGLRALHNFTLEVTE